VLSSGFFVFIFPSAWFSCWLYGLYPLHMWSVWMLVNGNVEQWKSPKIPKQWPCNTVMLQRVQDWSFILNRPSVGRVQNNFVQPRCKTWGRPIIKLDEPNLFWAVDIWPSGAWDTTVGSWERLPQVVLTLNISQASIYVLWHDATLAFSKRQHWYWVQRYHTRGSECDSKNSIAIDVLGIGKKQ